MQRDWRITDSHSKAPYMAIFYQIMKYVNEKIVYVNEIYKKRNIM